MKRILDKVIRWWNGTFIRTEYDPSRGSLHIIGGYKRHWTSTATRSVVFFARKEWKWLIGFFRKRLADPLPA